MLGMRFNIVFFLDRGVVLARVAPRDPRPGEATGDALHGRGSRARNVCPWLARCSPQNNLPARERHPSSKETRWPMIRGFAEANPDAFKPFKVT